MKGVLLKDSVNLFGLREGLKFWFKWSFSDPVKSAYLKYFKGGPICTYHGYFGCHRECNHEKIIGRRNIWKYEKELHQETGRQMKTIHGSETEICTYCGKEKGTEIIDDPNWDTLERWLVCKSCAETIELQREISFPIVPPQRQQEINERLSEIAKETGKPITNMCIEKDRKGEYHSSSVTFIGEK